MIGNFKHKMYFELLFTFISSAFFIEYMSNFNSNKEALLSIFYLNFLPIMYSIRIIGCTHFKIKPIFYMMQRRFKWWLVVFDLKIIMTIVVVSLISWLQITTILVYHVSINDIISWHIINGKWIISSFFWILIVVTMHRYWIHSLLLEVIVVIFLLYSHTLINVFNVATFKFFSWWYLLMMLSVQLILYMLYVFFLVFLVDIVKQTRYNNVAVERSLRSPDDSFIGKKSR